MMNSAMRELVVLPSSFCGRYKVPYGFMFLLAMFFASTMYGQEGNNITGNFYMTKVDMPVFQFNIVTGEIQKRPVRKDSADVDSSGVVKVNGGTQPGEPENIPEIDSTVFYVARAGTKFTALETVGQYVIIKFWKFEGVIQEQPEGFRFIVEGDTTKLKHYKYVDKAANNIYFAIPLDDFNTKIAPYYGANNSFVWGVAMVPIKLRFGGGDRFFNYSSSFSLGLSAGYEHSYRGTVERSISFLFGLSISSVSVDSATTMGYVDNSTNAGAFTPSIAAVYTQEKFQIGVFFGIDIIGGELGSKWVYRNSPWVGIGLGFTLFQKNKTPKDTDQGQ